MLLDSQELDFEFLQAFRAGKEHAFDRLFRVYFGPLTHYAHSFLKDEELSEDIVQDCFVRLWQRRKKLQHINVIKSYLYRCVYSGVMDELRKQKRTKIILLEEGEEQAIEKKIIETEIIKEVWKVMEHLPPRMAQVVKMYYLEEKSIKEISNVMGIDLRTAYSHRERALQLIRKTIIPG